MNAYLRGPSYVLGERETGYADIVDLDRQAAAFGLVLKPELWGWGTIRSTDRDLADLAADSARDTLRAAGVEPPSVDALVFCSTRVPGLADDHGSFMAKVLTGAGLGEIGCYGLNLNRCANLLAGLDVANAFVSSGRYRRVLVVTADAVAEGGPQMSQFALFSDGAASCLVAADPGTAASYQILGCAAAQNTATMDRASQISSDLAREVNDQLLAPPGLKVADVTALLHPNLFEPLLVMKERQAGFHPEQLYLKNIRRIGHCFAADPLINLSDRAGLGHIGEGHHCMLAASVPGSRLGVLLKRVC